MTIKKTDIHSYFDRDFKVCLSLWDEWKKFNALPESGGLWEQSNLWKEITDCVDKAVEEVKSWRQEK